MIDVYTFPGARSYENRLFRADEVRPNVFKISQPWFDPDSLLVYCFLIVGEKSALVYDTMFGYGNLREFCEEITDKPIICVDSHFHGDHAAGNFDFDSCFIHPFDLPGIYSGFARSAEQLLERARATARPECRDMLKVEDMCMPKPMYAYPIYDGDIFDLGGRQLEVVHVGGHSPGSIMLLDHENHLGFSGDTCNNDTILGRAPGDSIEEYRDGLLHLLEKSGDITTLFGGHEDFPATIIAEGVELCNRVIAGTDDHAEYEFEFIGRMTKALFAAEMKSFYRRVDGKDMNMQYSTENIHYKKRAPRILTGDRPNPMHVE